MDSVPASSPAAISSAEPGSGSEAGSEASNSSGQAAEQAVDTPQSRVESKLAPKLAAMHKRQKELFEREQKLKEQESRYQDIEKRIQAAKESPAVLLETLGFNSFEDLMERFAKDGGMSSPETQATRELQKRLDALEAEKKAAAEEAERQASAAKEKQAIDKLNSDIVTFLKQNSEKYELLQLEGASQEVFNEIQRHYQATYDADLGEGELLDFDTAAQNVENGITKILKQLLGTKRAHALLAEAKSAAPYGQSQSQSRPNTLLGSHVASTSSASADVDKSDDELLAEATAFLKQRRRT